LSHAAALTFRFALAQAFKVIEFVMGKIVAGGDLALNIN